MPSERELELAAAKENVPPTGCRLRTGQQLVVILLGWPGSGKSTFSRLLCDRTGAARVNGDLAKAELFGSLIAAHDESDGLRPERHRQAYALVERQAEEYLAAGRHLVRDYNHDLRAARDRSRAHARRHGALPVVAWIWTPPGIAAERFRTRPAGRDIPDPAHAGKDIGEAVAKLEPPRGDEACVVLDGLARPDDSVSRFAAAVGLQRPPAA